MLGLARLRTCAPGAPGGALRFKCSQSGPPCLTLMAQPSCDPRAGRRGLVLPGDASRGSRRGVGRVAFSRSSCGFAEAAALFQGLGSVYRS